METALPGRIDRALRHIDNHLDQPLRLDDLAAVAALSRYHFHRRFRSAVGLTVRHYILLSRLRRASYRLAFRLDSPVTAVALEAGFQSPEAFARAFKRHFGQSPSRFRARPDWQAWACACAPLASVRATGLRAAPADGATREVAIVALPDIPVAILTHRGDPATLGDSLRRFIAWRKASGLPPRRSATFNVLYGDPARVPPDEFRMDLCAATTRSVADNDAGIVAGRLPGGRCAVVRHVGADSGLGPALDWLFGVWLPQSGESRRPAPPYLHRLTLFPDVPEHEAVTDIVLPLGTGTESSLFPYSRKCL